MCSALLVLRVIAGSTLLLLKEADDAYSVLWHVGGVVV